MLRWRAIGYCADIVFPDLCGGMYRPEELGADVGPDGETIEANYTVTTPPPSTPTPPPAPQSTPQPAAYTEPPIPQPEPVITLNELLAKWGAQRIMDAHGGIPATVEQIIEINAKLEKADAEAHDATGSS
jgi:hypothetical protein